MGVSIRQSTGMLLLSGCLPKAKYKEAQQINTVPMCVPQCESQTNYVRRDVLGKVIDVWWNAPAPYCTRR